MPKVIKKCIDTDDFMENNKGLPTLGDGADEFDLTVETTADDTNSKAKKGT